MAARAAQIVLTPPGFIRAAMQNNATITRGRTGTVVTFTTAQGQRYAGTVDAMNLLTSITTVNPANNNAPLEVRLTMYKSFGAVRYPSRIVQTESGAVTADLTVNELVPNQAVTIPIPANVQQPAGAGRGN